VITGGSRRAGTRRGYQRPEIRRAFHRLAALAAAIAIASLNVACDRGPEPTLSGLDSLLAGRRFDQVDRRLDDYLEVHPESVRAHMLRAQVALARDPQQPQIALEHLALIRNASQSLHAVVKLNEGKALSALGDHARAEASWLEALRIDPLVPEAGWALLSLYYIEGRRQESERLGLALHAIEPDPRDRVQLLLELVRQDAKPIVPSDIVRTLGPGVLEHPRDAKAAIALALAHIRDSQPEEGLSLLNGLIERQPDNPEFWEALLDGLDEASRPDELKRTLAALPKAMAGEPRFARFLGIAAMNRRDWPAAATALERARRFDPLDSQIVYRLGRAYRLIGREAEAKKIEGEFRAAEATLREMLPLYNEANAVQGLGTVPAPDLYRRIAEARERLGRRAEALAWYRLVLHDRPDDAVALAAVVQLADVALPTLGEVLADSDARR
jgi:tetratricopeptide (TPR) repeat protein